LAEYSRFFGGSPAPSYDQNDFSDVFKRFLSAGVFKDISYGLQVTATDPPTLGVSVKTGEAWINGFWYQNSASLTKTLQTADSSKPRIDRIVLRLDRLTNRKISCEVLTGTPATSPSAPSLTQSDNTYEISLAQVYVGAGVTYVTDSNITDERDYVKNQQGVMLFGDQTIAGVKTFSSFPVTPSSAPTSDYQVANKKYCDDNFVTSTGTVTLTNKRITKRETTITSSATPTPNSDTTDIYTITALAENATFGAPSGTPTQGQSLIIRIKDNGTARTLAWNAIYRAGDISLPTTTIISKTMYLGFIYNSTDSKWDFVAYIDNI